MFISLSAHLIVSLSVCLPLRLFMCVLLSLTLVVCGLLPTSPTVYVCPSVSRSRRQFVCLPTCLFVSIRLSVHLIVFLSVCLYVYKHNLTR